MKGRYTVVVVGSILLVLTLLVPSPVVPGSAGPAMGAVLSVGATPAPVTPAVYAESAFALRTAGSTSSPAFSSRPGDLILAWFSLYGRDYVRSVTDSAGDSFSQLVNSSMTFGTTGAANGLSLWAATQVSGGPSVTLTAVIEAPPSWTVLAAATVADVTYVAASPIDWLGVPSNTSALSGQQSNLFSRQTDANQSDLVLSGVAARSDDNFTATGGDARVAQSNALLTGSTKSMTAALFELTQAKSSGLVWTNASSNRTVAWIGDSLSVRPSGTTAPLSKVRFTETGLPLAGLWSVTLGGARVGGSTSTISFFEPNGTYAYSVGSDGAFAINPAAGNVTVVGSSVNLSITFTGYIQHVVVIVMENGEVNTILAQDPYQRYLSNTFGNLSQFDATCHASPPNYFAITSGRTIDCETLPGGVANVTNLPDTLQAAGLTWGGYFESMPKACDRSSTPMYGTDHNPFLLYQDIVGNSSRCAAHVVNSAQFNQSVANGTLPTFSFYVPNMYDDCHSASRTFCDHWLKGFLAPILNSTSSKVSGLVAHTAFVVVYDEGKSNKGYYVGGIVTPYCLNLTGYKQTVCGGHTYATVISPYSVGASFRADATDISLISTFEWLLDLGSDGGYDGTSNFPALTSLFSFP